VGTETPSNVRQAKVSRWKTARKKLNEAAKHSVDAIYQKLKSEEVCFVCCWRVSYVSWFRSDGLFHDPGSRLLGRRQHG
jgi:hypothetical protein